MVTSVTHVRNRFQPATIIGGSCHKYHFCRDKSILVATKLLLRQIFVATKYNFVATKVLSQQTYFCRDKRRICVDKHIFVATKDVFCRDKHVFATKPLSRVCHKTFVATKMILVVAPANDKQQTVTAGIIPD